MSKLLLVFFLICCMKINATNFADLIIKNAEVFTVNNKAEIVEAFAVRDGKFIATGSNQEIDQYVSPNSLVIDLGGKSILPGFIDSHIHVSSGTSFVKGLDLFGIPKKSEWLKMIKLSAENAHENEWVIGGRWDHTLDRGILPLAADIDSLGINRPVALVDIDGHSFWVNSMVLNILEKKYGKEFHSFQGVQLDPLTKLPNGLLFETAMDLLYDLPEFTQQLIPTQESIAKTLAMASSLGITSVHDMSSKYALRLYKDLAELGQLPIRVVYGLRSDCEPINCSAEFGDLKKDFDYFDSSKGTLIKVGFFKITIDGVLSTRTASLLDPYQDAPTSQADLLIHKDKIDSYVKFLNLNNIPLAIHAIGDKAVKAALDSFEINGTRNVGNRIEHIEIINPIDIKRFKKLGVYPSMQPNHGTGVIGKYIEERVGERDRFAYMWKSMNEGSGNKLLLGSDWPTAPLAPLTQIADAVFRVSPYGLYDGTWFPEERLKLADAIKSYTLLPAIAGGIGKEVGSIEVGKWADFVILNDKISENTLRDVKIESTYLAGKLIYQNYD